MATLFSPCQTIAGKIDPVISVTAANITPKNAVGRIRNRATWNRPKIRPFTITTPRKRYRPRSPYNGR